MKEVLLLKNGELALKGLNRKTFEDMMIKSMRRRLAPRGGWQFKAAQSTVTVIPTSPDADLGSACETLEKVFGLAGFSRALALPKDMDEILAHTGEYLSDTLISARSFKVTAKRADKKFPFNSPQICEKLGEQLLSEFPHLTVDVHEPDVNVTVEIRDSEAFVHGNQIKGAGGMPTGSAGKAAVLISGGIDSPVAAWMMSKRGIQLDAIHFASPPYTSERAELKVHSLLGQVSKYSGTVNLHVVPFTELQQQIKDKCPEELFTIIMRRYMMRIAQLIAQKNDCAALITGESVGQVASQTLYALACTDAAVTMPVFRPLIGMDKDEVVAIARKIDTFDISVLPYEDCCTVFTPKHPRTHPKLHFVEAAEEAIDSEALIAQAVEGAILTVIDAY